MDTNDTRMLDAVFRNGSIWCTHSAGLPALPAASDRTSVFWYQLDPGLAPDPIVQSGLLDGGTGTHFFFPSIGVNCANDVCLGFSRSDSSRYIGAAYSVRLGSDPPGATGPIRTLKGGDDVYEAAVGGGRIPWGDYSATVVDPIDDRSFWTVQEFAAFDVGPFAFQDRWGTWWGHVTPYSTLTAVEDQRLVVSGAESGDSTAESTDVDGDTLVVGAPGNGVGGTARGVRAQRLDLGLSAGDHVDATRRAGRRLRHFGRDRRRHDRGRRARRGERGGRRTPSRAAARRGANRVSSRRAGSRPARSTASRSP